MQWPIWKYKDAVLHRDPRGAAEARAEARSLESTFSEIQGWNPGDQYYLMVWWELEAHDVEAAADDLVHWLSLSSSEDVDNDNSHRTNCRQVIDMVVRFFATPGTEGHPQAVRIREMCLELAIGAFPILNSDHQAAITRMARV